MVTGLFIGRFQPLHLGHVAAITSMLSNVDVLVIGVGSSQYGYTKDNPFTFAERRIMLEVVLKELRLPTKISYVIAIPDIHDYPHYVAHVESLIVGKCLSRKPDIIFTGNPVVKELFEAAGYKVEDPAPADKIAISGSMVRSGIASGDTAWVDLVPDASCDVIMGAGGVDRVKYLSRATSVISKEEWEMFFEIADGVRHDMGRHGCNDFPVDKYLSPEQHVQFSKDYEVYNNEEYEPGFLVKSDFMVFGFILHKLQKLHKGGT